MAFSFLNGYANDAPVAWHDGRAVGRHEFAADVAALRARLPVARYLINLCDNRYAFLTAFAAALADRRITLLPPDAGDAGLLGLCRQYEAAAVVSDRSLPSLPVPVCQWRRAGGDSGKANAVPASFSSDQTAVVVHTSGSTGAPQPHIKTWGALVRRARAVGARLALKESRIAAVVATVPSQHMYGIENAIMLPLQHGLAVHGERPLFPADVAAALDKPSLLVTTPIHLRAFTAAGVGCTGVRLILSSTAPLAIEQARRAEDSLGAPVVEIYGSTETGVVATRRTSSADEWRLLESLRLRTECGAVLLDDGGADVVVELHDCIELLGDGRFRLGPRAQDIVKVAGKRASLAALTESLCAIAGVEDAAFLAPHEHDEAASRLIAFVVAPRCSEAEIAAKLRARIDPIFLPRPLVKVEALPRNATGKLPREALQELWETIASGWTRSSDAV
ncbi:MAG TPA: AMP-binding protein [Gammaproteobacteria bacterium]|nr:AMP-binding protein [Gammaproteobacteria bacterium]